MRKRLVVIGNGMAPGRALEQLFEAAPDAYDVTIFNAEPRVNYDRIMLSPVLSGEKAFEEIVIHGDGWYVKHGITLYKGATVIADRSRRKDRDVRDRRNCTPTTSSSSRPARGRSSFPFRAHNLPGVLTYRDLDDVRGDAAGRQVARAVPSSSAAVCSASKRRRASSSRGMDVTVVHLMPTLMERQLDPAAGYLLKNAIEARGIERPAPRRNTKAILGDKQGRRRRA